MNDITMDGGKGLMRDADREGDWMQTWTGRRFYPADPRPEDIDIIDVAHALAHTSRYGGHCRFYSVAEHSVLVSQMVQPENALEGLLHDATEAYIADVIRPVKRTIGKDNYYFTLEDRIWQAVACKYGLNRIMSQDTKLQDTAICMVEQRAMFPRAQAWDFAGIPYPKDVSIAGLMPKFAAEEFLCRFAELTKAPVAELTRLLREYRRLEAEDSARFAESKGGLVP